VTSGLALLDWSARPTPFELFTGKGGVGKTTVAAATAVALADAGLRVLLVSTDPASNLADVFATATGEHPNPVAAVAGLDVMDLDPRVAADEYRARVIDPYRGVLPRPEIASLEEKLAGACTVEVAAFDTFARLLAEPALIGGYDHVVFDTAPTGHTLRLLSLPAAWSDYLNANPEATSCLGPLGGVHDHRPTYAAAVATLQDAAQTTVVLVARPDRRALSVAASAAVELRDLGIRHQTLVVNGVLAQPLAGDLVAAAYAAEQRAALAQLPTPLDELDAAMVPLVGAELVGVAALRQLTTKAASPTAAGVEPVSTAAGDTLDQLVDALEPAGRGVILVTGKGGVGKTTVAHLLAVALARRGHRVHLSTTDPAGRASDPEDDLADLTTSAIDPDAATADYVNERLAAAGSRGMDQAHLDLLAEDLRSPCSQELAVFQTFSQLLRRGRDEFVVIDTAPTGHTLLLLDVTGAFHRQVMQNPDLPAGRVHTPLMWLQDPNYSKLLIVTLAETTPVSEAAELQDDLRRAGIEPYGWIVNATLAGSGTADPVLRARAALEKRQIERIHPLASRVWRLPWSAEL
jgi:arsenite/tail-anchored protein-transporting ATPase